MQSPDMAEAITREMLDIIDTLFFRIAQLTFDQIIENAEGNTEVMLQMLNAIEQIAGAARRPEDLAALQRRIDTIEEVVLHSAKSTHAKKDIGIALELECVRAALR